MSGARLLEVELSVRREDCRASNVLSKYGKGGILVNLNIGRDESSHLLELNKNYRDVAASLRREGVNVSYVQRGKILALSPSCSSCKALAIENSVILSARAEGKSMVTYRLLSDKSSLKRVVKRLEDDGIDFKIIKEVPYVALSCLTPRQSEIVLFALLNGYFDVKRRTSLASIAKNFSIKPATADLILRRALKKIVDAQLLRKV
ncbi:MAG: helix-turn-helix domain-containing protein [Thermoplasmata archaeon]